MTQSQLIRIGIIFGVILLVLANTIFVVQQTQQALVVQFGDIRRVEQEPGLKFKIPFVQSVSYFDRRLLEFVSEPVEFITKDRAQDVEERVVIDAFVRYRITDPVRFYQAVNNEENLKTRLSGVVMANMRRVLANYSLNDLLSDKRMSIMRDIQAGVNRQATLDVSEPAAVKAGEEPAPAQRRTQGYGIEIVDMRIMRADLPDDISQSTFERMRKDFTKEAQKFRAEGEERALEVRSGADRERTEIIANAQRDAEIIRGEGDAEAARIYANSFGRDAEFFAFYRSMQAYRNSLKGKDTTVILSPDSEFLKELD